MRFRKCLFFSICLLVLSLPSIAEAKLFPGYIVGKNGDSVRCLILFKDWKKNPKTIEVETGGKRQTLGVTDIRGFGIEGYSDYRVEQVGYHQGNISGAVFPYEFSDSITFNTVFLKVIVHGTYTLYDLTLPDRTYYFFQSPDSVVRELVYRLRERDGHVQEDPQYKNELLQLLVAAHADERSQKATRTIRYSNSDIAPLFHLLNHEAQEKEKKIPGNSAGSLRPEIFAGLVQVNLPTVFSTVFTSGKTFGNVLTASGGVNLLYSVPGHFRSVKIGLSVAYLGLSRKLSLAGTNADFHSAGYHHTDVYSENVSIKYSMIQSSAYLMYVLNAPDPVKCYLKAGVTYSAGLGKNNALITVYQDSAYGFTNGVNNFNYKDSQARTLFSTAKFFPLFTGGVGVIAGRHRLEFDYSPPVESADDLHGYGRSYKFGFGGLYYFLSLVPEKHSFLRRR